MSLAELHRRVLELEGEVQQLKKDKEELYADLEQHLVQKEPTFWLSSNVHAQRLKVHEEEKERLEKELKRITAERNFYQEDNVQIYQTKQDADRISKEQLETNQALERELTFYKKQCARALEDRSVYSSDVEELKRTNLELEKELQNVNGRLEVEEKNRVEVEKQRDGALKRVKLLEERLVDCARLPKLESDLESLQQEYKELNEKLQNHEATNQQNESELKRKEWLLETYQKEKEQLFKDMTKLKLDSEKVLDLEKRKSSGLEKELEESRRELGRCTSELQNADNRIAAAEAEAESIRNSQRGASRTRPAKDADRVAQLERLLAEKEELLSGKTSELTAANEQKTIALQQASEWQRKWRSLDQAFKERTKELGASPGPQYRRSVDMANPRTSPGLRNWFVRQTKTTEESPRNPVPDMESLKQSLDGVLALVPKLRLLNERLEAANLSKTGSRRKSLALLDHIEQETTIMRMEMQTEEPQSDKTSQYPVASALVGKEAIGLASYSIVTLREFLNSAV